MKVHDVIPFGERQFLLNFWPVTSWLERFDPGQYYAANFEIVLSDGHASNHGCIVFRNRRRNFANEQIDSVYFLVKTDLAAETLHAAAYQMRDVGKEISEAEAIAWKSD